MCTRTTLCRIRTVQNSLGRADSLRLLALVLLWAAVFHALSAYGVDLLPLSFARTLSLEAYLALVHVVTMVVALGVASRLLPKPRETLALVPVSGRAIGTVLGLAPAAFALVTTVAFLVARPTLIEELSRGGRELVQRSAGEFGRELVMSPPLLALLWGAVLSPVSEELFFRGAVWTLAQSIVPRVDGRARSGPESGSLPVELFRESAVLGATRALVRWLREGGAATLFVAALFGVVHRDMPGGLGIVRFVSALGLGLVCGLARQHARSVLAPIVLHVSWNALSIAAVRRWVVTEQFPMKFGAPSLVSTVAVVGLAAVLAGWIRGGAKRSVAREP